MEVTSDTRVEVPPAPEEKIKVLQELELERQASSEGHTLHAVFL